jgi:hypothetical protein
MAMSTVLLGTEITRLRAPLVSSGYGNSERDWPNAVSETFLVHWSHRAVSEVVGDEPQTVTRVKILGGADLDLEATDRVVGPDGSTYEVDGEVMRSYPRGQLHHVRAFLRRITTSD